MLNVGFTNLCWPVSCFAWVVLELLGIWETKEKTCIANWKHFSLLKRECGESQYLKEFVEILSQINHYLYNWFHTLTNHYLFNYNLLFYRYMKLNSQILQGGSLPGSVWNACLL